MRKWWIEEPNVMGQREKDRVEAQGPGRREVRMVSKFQLGCSVKDR